MNTEQKEHMKYYKQAESQKAKHEKGKSPEQLLTEKEIKLFKIRQIKNKALGLAYEEID